MKGAHSQPGNYIAIVLAADREGQSPVARAAGVSCKALAPVAGKPMLERVLSALAGAQEVERCLVCGPSAGIVAQEPALQQLLGPAQVGWIEHEASPSLSVLAALSHVAEEVPVLLTTCDHALLTSEIVDYFCRKARSLGMDAAVGLARHEEVLARFPATRRTAYRFNDGSYCSCNLFALNTVQARQAPLFWRRVEQLRKQPLAMLRQLGLVTVARYLFGRLSLDQALHKLAPRLNCSAGAVLLPYPEASIDVDSAEDWQAVQEIAADMGNLLPDARYSISTSKPYLCRL